MSKLAELMETMMAGMMQPKNFDTTARRQGWSCDGH